MPTEEMTDRRSRGGGPEKLLNLPKIKATLLRHKLLWVAPTVLFTMLGLLYALTKSDRWQANQPLIVRDEAVAEIALGGKNTPLGRFENNDSLKRFLEIILQVAKNRDVARATLEQVGPEKPKRRRKEKFPSESDIEALIQETEVSAAKGTEFGTTEMIYLSVSANDRERAIALTTALGDELEHRMRTIRHSSSDSLIAELEEKRSLARKSLEVATKKLSAFEATLGADIGEMRTLAEPGAGGDSNLRTALTQLRTELREAEAQQMTLSELNNMLYKFRGNADVILAAPNELFESQPALRQLKDGLVEAQLRTARLRGGLTDAHPRVYAAIQNEKSIEAKLFAEVNNVASSLRADLELNKQRTRSLKYKLNDVTNRMGTLAAKRAPYVNLLTDVDQKRESLRAAAASLSEAKGRQEASMASSLITRLGAPETGSRPLGPSRKILILGSAFAGLSLGLSLVYLLAPWQEKRFGRRKTDAFGRRKSDREAPSNTQPGQANGVSAGRFRASQSTHLLLT